MTAAWHEAGVKVLYHSDGNYKKAIPDLMACGVDGFYCLEPGVGMDIVELKRTWPQMVWSGGVDGVDLMERGTPGQVRAEVLRHIRETRRPAHRRDVRGLLERDQPADPAGELPGAWSRRSARCAIPPAAPRPRPDHLRAPPRAYLEGARGITGDQAGPTVARPQLYGRAATGEMDMKLALLVRWLILLGLTVGGACPGGNGLSAQAEEGPTVPTRLINDFEGPEALAGAQCSKAITVALTTKGATSGTQAMVVTCASADQCADDAERRVYFDPRPFIDGSNFTRLAFDVTNPGAEPAGVHMTLYNPGAHSGWGYDGAGGLVPAGATRTITLDLQQLGRALQPMVDISEVCRIGLGLAQRLHDDVIVYVDHIRVEFNPAAGSPTEALQRRALQLQRDYGAAIQGVAWHKVKPDTRSVLQDLGNKLLAQVSDVVTACEQAEREGGFAGTYHEVNTRLHDLKEANEIGRLLLLGKPAFVAWEVSPYVNIFQSEFPAPGFKTFERLDLAMARQEYRDTVFMVSNNTDGDQRVEVSLETRDKALQASTLVQEALYLKNTADQIVGAAHARLEGPLLIPPGESRQIRVRFDATEGGLAPGRHSFAIRLRDRRHACEQTVPGTVRVWDFSLPDPNAIMSNNTYAEFCNSSLADLADLMVRDMKAYGLNTFFVHPLDIAPRDAAGNPHFTFENLDRFVGLVMDNWGAGPRPQFLFSLGGGIMPAEADLGAWVTQFQAVLSKYGIPPGEWYFVFGDEANERQLLTFETPLGEIMRRAAPPARISTNTSAMIGDAAARARHFATIDRWEPDLDVIHMKPDLLPYLRPTGKPIALFRCRGAYSVRGTNMYNYYRVLRVGGSP